MEKLISSRVADKLNNCFLITKFSLKALTFDWSNFLLTLSDQLNFLPLGCC